MMIVSTGINYVTESFAFVGRALSFGYNALCDILDAVGLPWEVYFLLILGFFIMYLVVGSVRDYWLASADSALNDGVQYQRRQQRKEAFNHRTQIMNENFKAINARINELNRRK